ncbi:MAG: VTT domain-containing protein [Methanomicrobiales archaeon]|nr:VTT domain-containing protein [Methanomicrobiales archaeon]
MIPDFLVFFSDIEHALVPFIENYGLWVYILLFLLTFLEAGIVLCPFLPGNTLLFIAGAVAAAGALDVRLLLLVSFLAAISSDSINYWLGRTLGDTILQSRYLDFITTDQIERVHGFYDRHGGRAILLARFFPYIRPLSPFIAGVVRITYPRFLQYDFVACALWTLTFVLLGFVFGDLPLIRNGINLLAVAFVVVTLASVVFILLRFIRKARNRPPSI